jgi:hypothetical protein
MNGVRFIVMIVTAGISATCWAKTIGVVLKHLTFRLMRVPYKSTGVKPY